MRCSLLVFLLAALPTLLSSAEPSAFGAGDLNSPTPYGLTSSEKALLETKKKLNQVSVKSNNQANELDSLRERIDGLQSIIESLSRKSHNNKMDLRSFTETFEASNNANSEYQRRIAESVELNKNSIDEIKKEIKLLSSRVDTIEKEYVSREDFNGLVKDVNNFKDLVSKELASSSSKTSTTASKKESSLSSAEIYDRAKMNFDRKYYTDAINDYEYLIKNNYKPAYAHYMIGEMNFRRKNYADAISYFKKSSALYSKASYMPSLMLHTAISMKESGDSKNAKLFFNAVIKKYPQSSEAAKAKEYLDKL